MFFLSLCRSEFLTFIIFLLSEELLLVFCAQPVCRQWISSVWLCLRKSLLCLHFQRIISPDIDCLVGGFFVQHFNCFTPLSSCVRGSWPEVWYDSYHCSSIVMAFPCFPWLLSRFHSLSVLLQLENDIQFFWYLYRLVFSELPRSMFWCLSFMLEYFQPLLHQIFILLHSLFLFLLVFQLCFFCTF